MKHNKLPRRIAMGIALGVVVGWACHHFAGGEQAAKEMAAYFSMVTDIFLRLIKMIIAPLVFATLVGGIASMGNSRSVGRIGFRAMAWFVCASAISLAIGMALVNLFAVFMLFKIGLRLMRDYDEQISAGVESPVLDDKKFADLDLDPSVWSANAAATASDERAEIGHAVHQR